MKQVESLKTYLPLILLKLFSGCDTTESPLGGVAVITAAGARVGCALGGVFGAVDRFSGRLRDRNVHFSDFI
jgi:hypothetical protein